VLSPEAYYAQAPKDGRYVREVSGPFEDAISSGQRKRIAKCERAGYRVGRSTLDICYPIILDNRLRKGRPYSMNLEMWREVESSVQCFALTPSPIAAAICVKVAPDVIYVQAWGDIPGQEQYSPVALLCKGIYNWCAENGIRLLDVGISDNAGVPDAGLVAFKKSLGFHL
jgi:hypothetical protein